MEETNFLVRLWRRAVYFLNTLLGEEPSDMLLKEQASSYQTGINKSYEMILKAGGRMGDVVEVLATNKAKLRTYQNNLNRSSKELAKFAPGTQEYQFKEQEVQMHAKMVSGMQKLVLSMETNINQSRTNQGMAELNFQNLNAQRDMANAEAGMYVDREAFAKMQEDIASAQLAAAGIINGTNAIRDHRGELRRRASRAEGRAEVATRTASQMTGFRGQAVDLDEDEQAILNDALAKAGVKTASQDEEKSAQA